MQYLPGKAYPTFNGGSQQARLVDPRQTQRPAPQQTQWHSSQQPQPPAPHAQQQVEWQARQKAQAIYRSFSDEAKNAMEEQITEAIVEDERRKRQSASKVDSRYGPAAGVIEGGTPYAHRQQNIQHTTFPNAGPLAKDRQYQRPQPLYSATESVRNARAPSTSAAPPLSARNTVKLTKHPSTHKPYAARNRGRYGSFAVRKDQMYSVCSECGLFWNDTKERDLHEERCTPEHRARKNAMLEYFCEIIECGEVCGHVTHERGAMWNHQIGEHGEGSADYSLL